MGFRISDTKFPDIVVMAPKLHQDDRGYFFESFNERDLRGAIGYSVRFVQDNQSKSEQSVLRGLHYQVNKPQGKLVRVIKGSIFDVVVDLRASSPTCGHWLGIELSATNFRQIWIPEGYAHGFLTLSESAEILYKTTAYYSPENERCISWSDPTLKIEWPNTRRPPILSAKDAAGLSFKEAELFP
jgi:dTDP-4-dehydrorhamnose 3,5-epimerase